jgi:hypothetical protein
MEGKSDDQLARLCEVFADCDTEHIATLLKKEYGNFDRIMDVGSKDCEYYRNCSIHLR